MRRTLVLLFLASSNNTWAHPGHGAPLFHWHEWDLERIIAWLLIVVIAALVAWKAK